MAAPSTTQQGQGFAQVLGDTFAGKVFLNQKAQEAEEEGKKAARIERSRAEVQGKLKDISGAKIWATRDGDDYRKEYMNRMGKYNGKWDLVAKGNTPEAEQFNQDILDLGLLAQKSTESKAQAEQWEKELFGEGANKYTDEDRAQFNEWVAAPLNFEQPKFLADFGIDPIKIYKEKAGDPYQEHAMKNYKESGGFGDEAIYRSKTITGDPKVREGLENSLKADPSFVSTVSKRFGDEAKAKGFDDPVEYFFSLQRPTYDVNIRESITTPRGGQGKKKEFDEANIIDDYTYAKTAIGSFGGTSYQTEGIRSNAPLTANVLTVENKKLSVPGVPQNMVYAYPTITKVDKSGKIIPKGSKQEGTPKIMVQGQGVINYNDGTADKVNIIRPFDEVREDFIQQGYDVDAIEQSLMNRGGNAPTKKNEVIRVDKNTGREAIFDAETKQFIRWK